MRQKKIFAGIKNYYSKICVLHCPQINSNVYFNNKGLIHLHRKNGALRPKLERIRRFKLFKKYIYTITNDQFAVNTRQTRWENSTCNFIALERVHGKKRIKIILRQINAGKIHFFSIMEYDT